MCPHRVTVKPSAYAPQETPEYKQRTRAKPVAKKTVREPINIATGLPLAFSRRPARPVVFTNVSDNEPARKAKESITTIRSLPECLAEEHDMWQYGE